MEIIVQPLEETVQVIGGQSVTVARQAVEVTARTEAVTVQIQDLNAVDIVEVGQQGAPGRDGDSSGDKTYRHVQSVPSDTWTVQHNLQKRPSVSIVDSGGSLVAGNVVYLDDNSVRLEFVGAFSGEAFLN